MDDDEIAELFHVLGLKSNASLEDVRKAYKLSAQAWHPDKFAEGSDMQKAAQERFIAVDNAKKKLEEFFEKNPEGLPEPKAQESKTATGNAPSTDEYIDWQEWEKGQATNFDDSVMSWMAKRNKTELDQNTQHERNVRSTQASWAKGMIMTLLVLIAVGRSCTGTGLVDGVTPERKMEREVLVEGWKYELQTHGTANGAVPLSDDEINQKWTQKTLDLKKKWEAENQEMALGYYLFYAFIGAYLFLLFAPPGRKFIGNWVESGQLNWGELKLETKAAAEKLATQAKDAGIKGAQAANDAAKKMKEQMDNSSKSTIEDDSEKS